MYISKGQDTNQLRRYTTIMGWYLQIARTRTNVYDGTMSDDFLSEAPSIAMISLSFCSHFLVQCDACGKKLCPKLNLIFRNPYQACHTSTCEDRRTWPVLCTYTHSKEYKRRPDQLP